MCGAAVHGLIQTIPRDPTRDDDLLAAHVKEALGLVAATGNDSDNV